jgi:fumarylacetoacetase
LLANVTTAAESGSRETIVKSNGRYLLYSFAQMLAHHSVGGCPMRVGDLLGSGTISGEVKGSEGALIELTRGGKEPCTLSNGQKRTFLEDGDTVTLRGVCGTEETGLVGFGECTGMILPSPCH